MGRLSRLASEIPVCPICEGPCAHEFVRSEYRMPDRLPNREEPEPAKKRKKRRGRRPTGDTARKPEADRMRRPSEDR